MSVASDEAEKKYPEEDDWYPGERAADGERTRQYLIEAYEDGRTAQATDDEVEIVAKRIYHTACVAIDSVFKGQSNMYRRTENWNALANVGKRFYRSEARIALEDARKKVAE